MAKQEAPEGRVKVVGFRDLGAEGLSPEAERTLRDLATVENTYLDVFPTCLIGSFAIPDKRRLLESPRCFSFYLDKQRLLFLDESGFCTRLLNELGPTPGGALPDAPALRFAGFLKLLVKDDLAFLSALEDRMEDVEEAVIDRGTDGIDRRMLRFRRELLRIDTYYQQLVDLASTLAENENRLLTREESRLFLAFGRQADRLLKRALTLKEYSLQLRELYQTQIDIQQNETIQWFTVITTIFVPLTLITSWYGMNFKNMPELDWRWGYLGVLLVCIVLVAIELVYFKRKRWL